MSRENAVARQHHAAPQCHAHCTPRQVSELCTFRLSPTHAHAPKGALSPEVVCEHRESASGFTCEGCASRRAKPLGGLAHHVPCPPRPPESGLAPALHGAGHGAAADWGFW